MRAQESLDREEETRLILEQLKRPVLPGQPVWRARYYDTLEIAHAGCRTAGMNFLRKLGLEVAMPSSKARANSCRQQNAECGYWVLHYIEEEARRKRGEGTFTTRYDLALRVSLLRHMHERLLSEQAAKRLDERARTNAERAAAKAKAIAQTICGS